jgi:metal-responsive CopG/Arc/MetJ family transcriptional regulator
MGNFSSISIPKHLRDEVERIVEMDEVQKKYFISNVSEFVKMAIIEKVNSVKEKLNIPD